MYATMWLYVSLVFINQLLFSLMYFCYGASCRLFWRNMLQTHTRAWGTTHVSPVARHSRLSMLLSCIYVHTPEIVVTAARLVAGHSLTHQTLSITWNVCTKIYHRLLNKFTHKISFILKLICTLLINLIDSIENAIKQGKNLWCIWWLLKKINLFCFTGISRIEQFPVVMWVCVCVCVCVHIYIL